MKWRTTPFPWYDDMAEILGESQGTGRYSFQFGAEDGLNNDEANLDPNIDPNLEAAANHDDDDSPEETPVETQGERRHRESSKLQPPPSKKQKVSGAGAIAEIGSGLHVLADAIGKKNSTEPTRQTVPQDTVDSTLQGQAIEKIQEEFNLTTEGQAFMIDFLGEDLALARAYVAIKKDELRSVWMKKQIEKLGGDLDKHFIDWNDSQ
jgi:hypothetical protein